MSGASLVEKKRGSLSETGTASVGGSQDPDERMWGEKGEVGGVIATPDVGEQGIRAPVCSTKQQAKQ